MPNGAWLDLFLLVNALRRVVCKPAPLERDSAVQPVRTMQSGSSSRSGCWLAAVPAYRSTQLCAVAIEPDQFLKARLTAAIRADVSTLELLSVI
jgi:hypothetical protein